MAGKKLSTLETLALQLARDCAALNLEYKNGEGEVLLGPGRAIGLKELGEQIIREAEKA